jgi:membrane-associated phospholipid phosphatase
VPETGVYAYLNRLLVGRPLPTHFIIRLLAPIALIGALALVVACARLLWLAPWPVDAFAAAGAAAGWTAWLDRQELA